MDKKNVLSLYQEISQVNKTELIMDLNRAIEEGTFSFAADLDKDRFFALLETLIDLRTSKGYEILLNQIK